MSDTLAINMTRHVRIPRVPNYLLDHEGESKWPISEFTEEQLRSIGRLWTTNLLNRAEEQRVAAARDTHAE